MLSGSSHVPKYSPDGAHDTPPRSSCALSTHNSRRCWRRHALTPWLPAPQFVGVRPVRPSASRLPRRSPLAPGEASVVPPASASASSPQAPPPRSWTSAAASRRPGRRTLASSGAGLSSGASRVVRWAQPVPRVAVVAGLPCLVPTSSPPGAVPAHAPRGLGPLNRPEWSASCAVAGAAPRSTARSPLAVATRRPGGSNGR